MNPCPAALHRSCATMSAPDVGRRLRAVVRPLLPGSPVVINRTLPLQDGPAGPDPVLRALGDGLRHELTDWSGHIVVASVLRHLERCLPGVTIPLHVWTAFSAVGDIARGQVLRGLLQLPVAALAPMALRQAVATTLQRYLPSVVPALPLHEPVVLAVTACVLLQRLSSRDPRRASEDPANVALLRLVQRLRAGLTVLGGLQRIASGTATDAPTHRAIAGPATLPDAPRHRPAGDGALIDAMAVVPAWPPIPGLPHAPLHAVNAPTWAMSAWPLPGADGARSRPRVRPKPPQRPVAPVKPAQVARPRRPSFQITRTVPGRHASAASATGAGVGISASGGMPSMPAAKKEFVWPGQSRFPAQDKGHPPGGHGHARGRVLHDPAPAPTPPPQSERPRCPADTVPSHAGQCVPLSRVLPALPAGTSGQACLRFEPSAHLDQLARLRAHRGATLFCVAESQQATFQTLLVNATRDVDGPWMKVHAVHETASSTLQVRRFAGLNDRLRGRPRPPTALGDDDLQTVLTLSHATRGRGHAKIAGSTPRLVENSFQLIVYATPEERQRTFVAWLASAPGNGTATLAAGFLELEHNVTGHWHIEDAQSGLTLGGESPAELIDALSWISGCSYVGGRDAAGRPLPLHTQHVFVGDLSPAQHATLAATPPARAFFDIIEFPLAGSRPSVSLLRSSYTIVDDTLMVVDRAGRSATFALATPSSEASPLHASDDAGREILAHCGLADGQVLPRDALMQALGDCGLAWVPPPAPAPVSTAQAAGDVAWYTFDGDQLRYVDAHGQRGAAWFVYRTGHARALRLADDTPDDVMAFARRLQILPATWYAEDELVWLLEGAGLTQRNDTGTADDTSR